MLGAPSTEVTPGHTTPHTPQSPAVSAKASPRPYQLQEKLVTINEIPSWEPPSTGSVNSGVATGPLSPIGTARSTARGAHTNLGEPMSPSRVYNLLSERSQGNR